jgi:hypothetical chaperone protein
VIPPPRRPARGRRPEGKPRVAGDPGTQTSRLPRVAPVAGCGIDFGTSNSAIALAWHDRVEVVRAEPSLPVLPSIVYLHRKGERRAGREAIDRFFATGHVRTSCGSCELAPYGVSECLQFRRDGGCNDSRLISGVKHDLAKVGFTGTNSWCTDFSAPDLVAVVLARLRSAGEVAAGGPLRRAVLGHPVVFAGEGLATDHKLALERLAEAARLAGFEEVAFLPEPEAALRTAGAGTSGKVTVAADFGGGTFDVAVLDAAGRIASLEGVAVGGERLDQVLFEQRVGPALGLDSLPSWLFNEMRSLSGVRLLLTDPGVPPLLERYGGPAAGLARRILLEGNALGFYGAIEGAKIELSDSDSARVSYPRLAVDVPVTRRYFESCIQPELEEVRAALLRALDKAGASPGDVAAVISTGGSSLIPVFERLLNETFPSALLERRHAFTSVVEGLGEEARRRWGGAA